MSVPRFWREIPQRYNLQASKCGVCAEVHFPPRRICPTCRRDSIGRISRTNLSGQGRVVEWTRVHKPASGYEDHVPYLLAIIETPEGPRLMGQLVECEGQHDEDLDGMQVMGTFRRLGADGDAGVIHYGIKWRPDPNHDGFLEEAAEGEEE